MAKKVERFNSRYIKLTYESVKKMYDLLDDARNQEYDEHSSIDDDSEDYVLLYPDGTIKATAYYKTYADKESLIDVEQEIQS